MEAFAMSENWTCIPGRICGGAELKRKYDAATVEIRRAQRLLGVLASYSEEPSGDEFYGDILCQPLRNMLESYAQYFDLAWAQRQCTPASDRPTECGCSDDRARCPNRASGDWLCGCECHVELPEELKDPKHVLERGRELLKEWEGDSAANRQKSDDEKRLERDKQLLDYLVAEKSNDHSRALFRRNMPITRGSIARAIYEFPQEPSAVDEQGQTRTICPACRWPVDRCECSDA